MRGAGALKARHARRSITMRRFYNERSTKRVIGWMLPADQAFLAEVAGAHSVLSQASYTMPEVIQRGCTRARPVVGALAGPAVAFEAGWTAAVTAIARST